MSKIAINFNVPFKGFDGQPVQENGNVINLGYILSQRIAYSNSPNSQKLMYIGFQLYEGKEISLDPVDKEILKKFIESDEVMTNMIKFRLLELF